VRIGALGCGNYATTMIYPHLVDREDVELRAVATATALSAMNAKNRFGFGHTTTDYHDLLEDDAIDAIIIATRHASHAALVSECLRAGKTVFVEKPLAIALEQLDSILDTIQETGNDRIMVGFNRRFSPLLNQLRTAWGRHTAPESLMYVVNAGSVDSTSWYAQAELHGSRFAGEGGHFIDTASWWLGMDPVDVTASGGDERDMVGTLTYPDGSMAQIAYATGGHPRAAKEVLTVHGGSRSARFEKFTSARLWKASARAKTFRSLKGPDKGQSTEMEAFVHAAKTGEDMPIPVTSLVATTRATLAFGMSASRRATVTLDRMTPDDQP
jgi:predicted dehydrogenase